MSTHCIFRISDLNEQFNDLVGKKCANLGVMASLGLRVPQGFSLSLEAYKKFMRETGADKEIADFLESEGHSYDSIEQYNKASEVMRGIVESKKMPSDLEDRIVSHYEEVCRQYNQDDVSVSTRSAGTASHPGQYETYLNVKGGREVIEHIKKVWSSTFNPRSLSARKRAGVPLGSDPIGVAVIKMVEASSAGVMFTADPNTGDTSRIIIEANWGLGESVVGGETMPDVYVLEKESLHIIEKKLGTKKRYITVKEFGVREEETTPEMSSSFCLTDEEAREICRLGKTIEDHFGVPQDTEWAIDKDLDSPDNVVMLQARPEVIAKKKKPVDEILDLMMSRLG